MPHTEAKKPTIQVLERAFDRLHGMVTRVGERKAIALVAMALHDQGIEAASFTGSSTDWITNFEHVIGGAGADTMDGSTANNSMTGGGAPRAVTRCATSASAAWSGVMLMRWPVPPT